MFGQLKSTLKRTFLTLLGVLLTFYSFSAFAYSFIVGLLLFVIGFVLLAMNSGLIKNIKNEFMKLENYIKDFVFSTIKKICSDKQLNLYFYKDYKRNEKYFEPLNITLSKIMVAFGVIMIISNHIVLAALGFIAALVVFIIITREKISDAEFDEITVAFFHDVENNLLSELGIDKSQMALNPIVWRSYLFEKISADGTYKMKNGRSSNCILSAYYFTKTQVHYYEYSFSLICDELPSLIHEQVYYKDISNYGDNSQPVTGLDTSGNTSKKLQSSFSLITNAGTEYIIMLNDEIAANQFRKDFGRLIEPYKCIY
jgi:hypothetical protein